MDIDKTVDARWGVTAVRVMTGVILAVAGIQKWLGGIGGFAGFVGSLGFPAPEVIAPVIATGEVIGGLLILLGIKARFVALWFVAGFIVTSFVVKLAKQGFDAGRIDLMILAASLMLVLAGAGKLAVDEYLGRREELAGSLRPQSVTSR